MKALVIIGLLIALAPTSDAFFSIHASWDWEWDWELSAHGRWVYVHDVGRVWVPRVHVSWQPYSQGHWAWSEWGWMWVSYEPWHSTFHYGRWIWVDYHGWVWVPGYEWGPSWVVWNYGPDYVAWAPMPPHWCQHRWPHYWNNYHRYHRRWIMVDPPHFTSHSVYKYKSPEYRVKNKLNIGWGETGSGKTRFADAPARGYVEKYTGKRLETVSEDRIKSYSQEERDLVTKQLHRERSKEHDGYAPTERERVKTERYIDEERETYDATRNRESSPYERSDDRSRAEYRERQHERSEPSRSTYDRSQSDRERSSDDDKKSETDRRYTPRSTPRSSPAEQSRDTRGSSTQSRQTRSRETRPYYSPSRERDRSGSQQRSRGSSSSSRSGYRRK